ncbi:MAG: AAA domain-containing protein [Chloroflexota bacterium]|nr:AAA domain-containing protein [Chloroflexota bacterium]
MPSDGSPLFPATGKDGVRHVSPTDVSQFIRLEQCERYLRLRLHERTVNRRFMEDYGVVPQRIPPLLTRSGALFEQQIEEAVAARYDSVNFFAGSKRTGQRAPDNDRVATLARDLPPGDVLVLFQARLEVEVEGWKMRGDADILRLERDREGSLRVLIADMKASATAKIEHRLQVAFYHEMLATLLSEHAVPCDEILIGILYRGGPEETGQNLGLEDMAEREKQARQAEAYFGARDALLEIVPDKAAYLGSVRDLVTAPDSTAERVRTAPFVEVPYHLTYKCDGCLYNELCMKWSAQHDDLSLLPHLATQEKSALRARGITTMRDLATLKQFRQGGESDAPDGRELVPSPGREALARKLATTWPLGPRIDELVHRARRYRKFKRDPIDALSYIPSKGYGSLPYSDARQNPNLVRVYIDAQHDYLHEGLYMLGALVVGCENGEPRPERRRSIVHLTSGPPDTPEKEEELLLRWITDVTRAIVELAAADKEGKPRAPIHLVFYDGLEQRLLLEGLGRHLNSVLGATPLYDFVTQLAAFDSPIATFLDAEIRELKNYPMVCQSLQAVAAYLKFDWNSPEPYRDLFRERLFDFWGKLDGDEAPATGESPWYTNRARFGSNIPLEHAYAAWGELDSELARRGREADDGAQPLQASQRADAHQYAPYRKTTRALLTGFQARRLEALEWVAKDFKGNKQTEKSLFELPNLADFEEKARTLAHALDEFVTIERHVALGDWKRARLAPPERRVLAGDTLLARYHEEDQEGDTAERNRENEERRKLKEQYVQDFWKANPNARRLALPADQRVASNWSQEGMRFRLRLDCGGVDCDPDEALRLSDLREGNRVVVSPRTSVDERLPVEERVPYTPTPKQMLYGTRAEITRLDPKNGCVEIVMRASFGNAGNTRTFLFGSIDRPLIPGELYTLDEDPNDIYGYWGCKVVEGLVQGGRNALYDRISRPSEVRTAWTDVAAEGQRRFREGLQALHEAGALHDFEPSKREYMGSHGDTPTLLVQGPPGTGKSYTTAFVLFARIQGAMAAGLEFRALVSCKTHAATDVLLENLVRVQQDLERWRLTYPEIFHAYFDPRLRDVPLYRLRPRGGVPDGVTPLHKDDDKPKGEPRAADRIQGQPWCVVASTPGAIYQTIKDRWPRALFGHDLVHCLVLDEASQMNLPEAAMAALPLRADGQLIVVGDHRQMPPIIKHDWEAEPRRTFQQYRSYESLFLTLLPLVPQKHMIKFEESFRLHSDMAEFLRREVYRHDGIEYRSQKRDTLPSWTHPDPFVESVLRPEQTIVVVVHDERDSQLSNPFERDLIRPVLEALAAPDAYALDSEKGMGVVVPHRAQRVQLQEAVPALVTKDPETGVVRTSAVDTVERFQGGERRAILVSATESDRAYLLFSSEFLLDPRRLTVALSRAKEKMVLVASRSVFELFSADEETYANSQLWKNLLCHTCTELLWEGEKQDTRVQVWGNAPRPPR